MRFVKVMVLALTLLAVTALPSMVEAADSKFELYGGLTRNTMTLNFSGSTLNAPREESGSAVGWHVGGRYWFNPQFAAGLMVDSFGFKRSFQVSGSKKQELDTSITGYLAMVSYQVAAQGNWRAMLEVGAGPYSGTFKAGEEPEQKSQSAIGFLVGARVGADLTEHLSLEAVANYRSFSADMEKSFAEYKKVDVNGFAVGVGLVYHF